MVTSARFFATGGGVGEKSALVHSTNQASCRAAATSKNMLKYLHAESLHI